MHLTAWMVLALAAGPRAAPAAAPELEITRECQELIPLFPALPPNECHVTSLLSRRSDGLFFGASCGKRGISLFSFDHRTGMVTRLDSFEALWWDEPRLALGPEGDLYLGARRTYDKQFVHERLRERPHTPGSYERRGSTPPPGSVREDAPGMPVRHYSPAGRLLGEIPLPAPLAQDGVGALAVAAEGRVLCGLSAPGGRLFTIALPSGGGKDLGEVVHFPEHHHTRPVSRTLLVARDGKVYLAAASAKANTLHALDPLAGTVEELPATLPAVSGRERFASIDAALELPDGSFLGSTADGYLFRFDPCPSAVECFGKPLRQHRIWGLAPGPEGLVYGVGGERGSLPRLFAFDPHSRTFHLGMAPTGNPSGEPATFGEVGALASAPDGTLVCGERERRGYLLVYRPRRREWRQVLAGSELAACTRDRFTDVLPGDGGAVLAPTYLISDAMARSSKVRESLEGGVQARQLLFLFSPPEEAQLLFFGGGGTPESPLRIAVNGREIRHIQDRARLLTGGWDRETVPGEYLKEGENELIFSGSGFLLVDTDAAKATDTGGGSSFKRRSDAEPWRADRLGPHDDLRGEYVVRIRARGHPPAGRLTSPVIDLAALAPPAVASGLPPLVTWHRLRLEAAAETPPGTAVALEVRTGSTPDGAPASWSAWSPLVEVEGARAARFLQWRAVLSTRDTRVTPRLERVAVGVQGEPRGANGERVRVTLRPDNRVALSSYRFEWADPHHPRLRHLREKYRLEEVVARGATEAETLALLRQWVRERWEGWQPGRYAYCPPWDALEILELAPRDLALGMCTHYAAVFTQCAAALGYASRMVIADHHCLAEVWSDQYGKWILQDPGPLPGKAATFRYEAAGVPLSALELHERALRGDASDLSLVPPPPGVPEELEQRLLALFRRFAIVLRNDHLYRPEPQELEHGFDQYHWDGYLWWTDSLDPLYPEYSLETRRREDIYWTVNRTVITLSDTEEEGSLEVQLSGPVPNLEGFWIRTGGDTWRRAEPRFRWELRAGRNQLEARARNTMGLEGPPNQVELEYREPSSS